MRRTQLYLEDRLWNARHTQARSRKTTTSELVREALRERYLGQQDERRKAMQEFIGIAGGRLEWIDPVKYVRSLWHGHRLDRLKKP